MGATGYGLRRGLSVLREVRIHVEPSASRHPAGNTVALGVSCGIANVVPARWDPVFRRRLGRCALGPAATAQLPALGDATKLDVILRLLADSAPVPLTGVDLDRGPSSLRLAVVDRRLRVCGGVGGAAETTVSGPGSCETHLSPQRRTTRVLILAIGEEAPVQESVDACLSAFSALCGARTVLSRSFALSRLQTGAGESIALTGL